MLQSCEVADERRDKLWQLGERGRQAGRAGFTRRRSLQGDGVQAQRAETQAETGNLPLCRRERQPLHEHGIPHSTCPTMITADVLTFSPNGDYVRVKNFGHGEDTGICD